MKRKRLLTVGIVVSVVALIELFNIVFVFNLRNNINNDIENGKQEYISKVSNDIKGIYRMLSSEHQESIVFNVMDFGAKGDWNGKTGTDDTKAIQAAIDAAELTENATVVFPTDGRLFLASGLNIQGPVNIIGNDCTLVIKDGMDKYFFKVEGLNSTDIEIVNKMIVGGGEAGVDLDNRKIKIKGKSASNLNVGDIIKIKDADGEEYNEIKSISSDYLILRNRPLRNYHNPSILKCNMVQNVTIKNINMQGHDILSKGIFCNYVSDCEFEGIRIENAIQGIKLENSNNVKISKGIVRIEKQTGDAHCQGVNIEKTNSNITVSDCTIYHGRCGIVLSGNNSAIVHNHLIASGGGNTGDGIFVSGSDNVIDSNIITAGDCYGIWVREEQGNIPYRNIISDNVINGGVTYGIALSDGSGHIVSENVLRNNAAGVDAATRECVLANNSIEGNAGNGISLSGIKCTVTGNILSDNDWYGICLYDDADYCIIKDNILKDNIIYENSKTNNLIADNMLS